MAAIMPTEGEKAFVDMALSDASPNSQVLRLYSNNYTPGPSSTSTDFTETTVGGYSAITLTRATWNAATDVGGATRKTYPEQTWSFTGTDTIYGWYIEETTTGDVLFAEKFTGGGITVFNGDQFKITPSVGIS